MGNITDIVKHLIIINVIVFLALATLGEKLGIEEYFILMPLGQGFQPYQIVTSMFTHFDIRHIFMNMLGLFFIGPIIESTLGPKRFLFLYLSAGILSGIFQIAFTSAPAIGASGCINGVMVALALIYPNLKLMIFPIPFEIKAIILVSLYILYDLFSGVRNSATGVAHFAHLGGAVMGAFLIFYWKLSNLGK
jgi:membrane associated rhomboid family serine protease